MTVVGSSSSDPTRTLARVVHVTESMSAGVLDVLANLTVQQAAAGTDVRIVYTIRPETPSQDALARLFPGVSLVRADRDGASVVRRLVGLRRTLARLLAEGGEGTVVHLHSSYAGLAGRSLGRRSRNGAFLMYSPHGFAHLREDKPTWMRRAFAIAESLLARRGDAVVAVSSAEALLAERLTDRPVRLLQNRIDVGLLPLPGQPRARLVVGNIGRAAPQKGFDRFSEVAARLRGAAEFRWIGGGDEDAEQLLRDHGVHVTGWVDRADALRELTEVDVLLFPSRWEGMPVALMEAQAMGIPAVAWDCVGVSDVIADGVTGHIVGSVEEAVRRVRELLEGTASRARLGDNAKTGSRRFDVSGYGEASLELYRQLVGPVQRPNAAACRSELG